MDGSDLDTAQSVEDKLISEEYRVWKKNTPFLYDFILTHALDWPSLTVQWLPDEGKSTSAADLVNHKLIIGTQSDESAEAEANYLMIADVLLPSQDAPVDARAYNRDKNELVMIFSQSISIEKISLCYYRFFTICREIMPAHLAKFK